MTDNNKDVSNWRKSDPNEIRINASKILLLQGVWESLEMCSMRPEVNSLCL